MTDEQIIREVAEKIMGWKPPIGIPTGPYIPIFEHDKTKSGKIAGYKRIDDSFHLVVSTKEYIERTSWHDETGNPIGFTINAGLGSDFNPILDANHRDMVVAKLASMNIGVELYANPMNNWTGQGHYVAKLYLPPTLQNPNGDEKWSGWQNTPGHAVCLAALKAEGGE